MGCEIDITKEFERETKGFSPINIDEAIDKAKERCDGLSPLVSKRKYSIALSNTFKYGVKTDASGVQVPIANKNIRSRKEQKERNDAFVRMVMNNDPEYLANLLTSTYGSPQGSWPLESHISAYSPNYRCDFAEGSIYFARELEYFQAVSKDILYPAANYNQIWGIDSSAGGGASRTTYSSYDFQGSPAIVQDNSNVTPLINMTGKQYSMNIYTIRVGFLKTFQEIRAAIFANKPFDTMQISTARMAVEQYIDKMAFLGNSLYELPGLLTINGATALAPSGGTTFADKIAAGNPGGIQADLLAGVSAIANGSLMTQTPDTLILPISTYIQLFGTPRSENSDTTIGSYFMQNNPCITRVFWSQWLSGVSSTGTDAYVMFDSSEERIRTVIPMPYTQHAPVLEDTAYKVVTETRFGGVACYYPNSVAYMVGI